MSNARALPQGGQVTATGSFLAFISVDHPTTNGCLRAWATQYASGVSEGVRQADAGDGSDLRAAAAGDGSDGRRQRRAAAATGSGAALATLRQAGAGDGSAGQAMATRA